ncbi:hypothetical protein F1188_00930 [Roseospira marina]|uniref:Uncharacterized protein n=1 Tax=Roseospira marina TaxID=140057 RepID=A0A5M6IGC6_9PROT|nr:hypothetical protein [Roseospira marina]KAA5607361.1 hypothetical protein F1188_00930 [Roseospira marina]MBB4312471.1 hypothetical protein [Roseospira marina]MBB5085513.1 hypothetical protein [Roseospira marina]
MSGSSERARVAIQTAYNIIMEQTAACDSTAFEVAVDVYRRFHPHVPEMDARDETSQIVADGAARPTLDLIAASGGFEAVHARTAVLEIEAI